MIESEFDSSSIVSYQFGVSLYKGGRYLVPVDNSVNETFSEMLTATTLAINSRSGEWEDFSLSQDYGSTERVYSSRSEEIFRELSDIYEVETYPDMTNFLDDVSNIDFYFVIFHDSENRKFIGVRKAAQLKSTLSSRNRLVQLIDNTMFIIENPYFDLIKRSTD